MRKQPYLPIVLLGALILLSGFREGGYRDLETAEFVAVNAVGFSGNFNSANCDTVQECLETIDSFSFGGTPGGSSGELQYNNAGAFSGVTGSSVSGGAITLAAPLSVAYTGTSEPALGSVIHYTGTTGFEGLSSVSYVDTAAGNDTLNVAGLYAAVVDTHATSGVIADANDERSAFDINYSRTADSSVEWQDGGETIRGYNAYVYRAGAFTGLGHPLTVIGHDTTVTNDVSYNNASGVYQQTTIGSDILVQSNGNLTSGTLTKNVYGQRIQVGSNASGTSNAYGLYITSVLGADNNYPIYSLGTGSSYLAGDINSGGKISGGILNATPHSTIQATGTTAATSRIGWAYSPSYGQTYITADFSSVSQNGNAQTFYINQIGGTGTQWLRVQGNLEATFAQNVLAPSGAFYAGAGTVSSPSLSFNSDPNTGLYRVSADILGLSTGGTEALRLNASQNAGFSTTNIRGKAHFTTSTAPATHVATIVINNKDAGTGGVGTGPYTGIDFSHYIDSANDYQRKAAFGFERTTTNSRGDFIWSLNNVADNSNVNYLTDEKMRLTSDGKLGIGTGGTVSAKIHAVSTTEQLRSGYDALNYWGATTGSTGITTINAEGSASSFIFSDDVSVPSEVYGAGWNGSVEVPTKNDIYDKIESLSSGGLSQSQVLARGLGA